MRTVHVLLTYLFYFCPMDLLHSNIPVFLDQLSKMRFRLNASHYSISLQFCIESCFVHRVCHTLSSPKLGKRSVIVSSLKPLSQPLITPTCHYQSTFSFVLLHLQLFLFQLQASNHIKTVQNECKTLIQC